MPKFVQRFRFALATLFFIVLPLGAQENVRFGEPERSANAPFADAKLEDHRIVRKQYVVSYNGKSNRPNWVSWNLRAEDIGPAERQDKWMHDPDLPPHFTVIPKTFYARTGFERGHMCPSEDRTKTQSDNDATFTFANAVPQAPKNNKNGWRMMEAYCQKLAKEGNDLHIVCGPHGRRGQGSRQLEFSNFLFRKEVRVEVPAVTWKVVLVLPSAKVKPTATTRVIAVVMPNDQTVTTDWGKYRCSLEHVEELTDYKFFPKVAKEVHDELREQIDDEAVKKPKKAKKKKAKGKKNDDVSLAPDLFEAAPSVRRAFAGRPRPDFAFISRA